MKKVTLKSWVTQCCTSKLKFKIHQTENNVEQLPEVSKELSHQLGQPEERATAIAEGKQALTRDLIESEVRKRAAWVEEEKQMFEKESKILQQTIDMRNHTITKMKWANKALEDENKHLVKAVVVSIEKNKSIKEKMMAVELEKEGMDKNLMEPIYNCTKLKGHLRYKNDK